MNSPFFALSHHPVMVNHLKSSLLLLVVVLSCIVECASSLDSAPQNETEGGVLLGTSNSTPEVTGEVEGDSDLEYFDGYTFRSILKGAASHGAAELHTKSVSESPVITKQVTESSGTLDKEVLEDIEDDASDIYEDSYQSFSETPFRKRTDGVVKDTLGVANTTAQNLQENGISELLPEMEERVDDHTHSGQLPKADTNITNVSSHSRNNRINADQILPTDEQHYGQKTTGKHETALSEEFETRFETSDRSKPEIYDETNRQEIPHTPDIIDDIGADYNNIPDFYEYGYMTKPMTDVDGQGVEKHSSETHSDINWNQGPFTHDYESGLHSQGPDIDDYETGSSNQGLRRPDQETEVPYERPRRPDYEIGVTDEEHHRKDFEATVPRKGSHESDIDNEIPHVPGLDAPEHEFRGNNPFDFGEHTNSFEETYRNPEGNSVNAGGGVSPPVIENNGNHPSPHGDENRNYNSYSNYDSGRFYYDHHYDYYYHDYYEGISLCVPEDNKCTTSEISGGAGYQVVVPTRDALDPTTDDPMDGQGPHRDPTNPTKSVNVDLGLRITCNESVKLLRVSLMVEHGCKSRTTEVIVRHQMELCRISTLDFSNFHNVTYFLSAKCEGREQLLKLVSSFYPATRRRASALVSADIRKQCCVIFSENGGRDRIQRTPVKPVHKISSNPHKIRRKVKKEAVRAMENAAHKPSYSQKISASKCRECEYWKNSYTASLQASRDRLAARS